MSMPSAAGVYFYRGPCVENGIVKFSTGASVKPGRFDTENFTNEIEVIKLQLRTILTEYFTNNVVTVSRKEAIGPEDKEVVCFDVQATPI